MTGEVGRPADPASLARALRQRVEAGAPPLFLEDLDRDQALQLVRQAAASRGSAAPVASPPPAVPTPDSPPATSPTPAGAAPENPVAPGAPAVATGTAAASSDVAGPPPDVSGFDLPTLRSAVEECARCRLSTTRTQAVFADGAPDARVMVVGEAPGANEDRTGLPFVGAAGKLLDLMLASVDLSRRDSVYICNVIKCRPPGNRDPKPDEIDTCSPYLLGQIEQVRPEALLAVGTFAGRLLTAEAGASLGSLRGRVHRYQGLPLVVTYHPAALLRNRGWTRSTWDDLQLLRAVLEGVA
ncbi:MAG: uracil-DNA glycosylase [Gemmatimonadetes bacterium]|nr:uracil-DNA glycosylase [Gemmatimonadota bacterium]